MRPSGFLNPLLKRSIAIGIVIGVFASLIANWLSARFEDSHSTPWLKATLLLACLVSLLVWIAYVLVQEIRRLESSSPAQEVSGVMLLDSPRSLADVLPNVREELWFLGILAKRSVNDDRFKEFLRSNAGGKIQLRFLLLNPQSHAFLARAREERESHESWHQELNATLDRLRHYKTLFNIDIPVRFYDFYPLWRLIVVDRKTVTANCFVENMRGTQSQQLSMKDDGPDTHLAHMFVKLFSVIWAHHSSEVIL